MLKHRLQLGYLGYTGRGKNFKQESHKSFFKTNKLALQLMHTGWLFRLCTYRLQLLHFGILCP